MKYTALFNGNREPEQELSPSQPKLGIIIPVGLLGIIIIACLISPWIKQLFLSLAPHSAICSYLAEYELHRILSRVILVLVVLSLIVFRKTLFSSGRAFAPLEGTGSDGYLLMAGFVLGLATLIIQVSGAVIFDARELYFTKFTPVKFLLKGSKALFSCLLIGVLEEFIFRGVVFRQLRRRTPLFVAFAASSALYGLLHFFKPHDLAGLDQTAPLSGFIVVIEMLKPFVSSEFLFEFVGLFIAGMCLAAGYHYSKSLYFSIGLHAGWVFVIKMDGMLVTRTVAEKVIWWGSSNLVGGVFTWALLAVIFALIVKLFSDWI
ncbi:MAG: CPBP family intramembrane glutamic endopeptidase [Candidatus Auribacterota bacterium]|jgi:membrane protease YdiL (CAAX protease family)|uniref:CPBP family intramembrane metalloprotease n=1 Tax=Candidatus Auribacter fodinae TaxID=2093366 RepID=A0A3A4QZ91_9BACT|nr:MAG: CPBP family intramembrane metalloprotease [Candidatus Auribacter fodinae]